MNFTIGAKLFITGVVLVFFTSLYCLYYAVTGTWRFM